MIAKKSSISTSAAGEIKKLQVETELERILASPGFRTSKRSQEFLSYIVTTALDGRFEDLKERVIGNQVFQRQPDYDTGEHSIVRVKANELRKRLAQFYGETGSSSIVEIHLPKGSYIPEYRWIGSSPTNAPALLSEPVIRLQSWQWAIGGGVLLALLCLLSWFFIQQKPQSEVVEQFWKPVLTDSHTPLLCIGSPDIWKLSDKFDNLALEGALPGAVPPSELTHDANHYVGWGDALALTQLSTFFVRHQKDPEIRLANDVSFFELSHSPVILIGARSNPWTMQLANNMRFVFEATDNLHFIVDKANPGKKWTFEAGPPKVDYIVISRIFESKTGRMIVLAAGLSHYGTQLAGQILSDPAYLQKALRNAPKDWPARNMQLLFRVEVFGNTAGSPVLEESSFW